MVLDASEMQIMYNLNHDSILCDEIYKVSDLTMKWMNKCDKISPYYSGILYYILYTFQGHI